MSEEYNTYKATEAYFDRENIPTAEEVISATKLSRNALEKYIDKL